VAVRAEALAGAQATGPTMGIIFIPDQEVIKSIWEILRKDYIVDSGPAEYLFLPVQ
jgi:hypothetical protein